MTFIPSRNHCLAVDVFCLYVDLGKIILIWFGSGWDIAQPRIEPVKAGWCQRSELTIERFRGHLRAGKLFVKVAGILSDAF
jgi:hypothetical protein